MGKFIVTGVVFVGVSKEIEAATAGDAISKVDDMTMPSIEYQCEGFHGNRDEWDLKHDTEDVMVINAVDTDRGVTGKPCVKCRDDAFDEGWDQSKVSAVE